MLIQAPDSTHYRVRPSRRRLVVAHVVSAALITLLLTLTPAPRYDVLLPSDPTLEISMTQIDPQPETRPPTEPPTAAAVAPPDIPAPSVTDAMEAASEPAESEQEEATAKIDWYARLEDIAENSDQFRPETPSMSPAFDEKRRRAALQFAASTAPIKKPIWENVEMDQMGRKILWHKGCYRVIEDNAVTRRWVHENFTQYIVFCEGPEEPPPIQIAFSKDRFSGYRYLADPDGSESSYAR